MMSDVFRKVRISLVLRVVHTCLIHPLKARIFVYPMQGSTLRLLNHLPNGQVPFQFDLPASKIYLPDVVFVTPNQGGPTFPEKKTL